MSDKEKSEGNVVENNSTATKSQSKKKERRSKGNKEASKSENSSKPSEKSQLNDQAKNSDDHAAEAGTSNASVTETQLRTLLDEYSKPNISANLLPLLRDAAKTPQEAMQKSFKFWSTQPVPKFDEKIEQNEAIEPDKPTAEIRAEPYALPDGFKWETMNLTDPLVLTELYTLLNENYVEDDDAMFRFDYQPEFLRWALQPPGWRQGKRKTSSHIHSMFWW